MVRSISFIITTFFVTVQTCFAQSSNTGNWLFYLGNHSLNKKWNVHTEVQHRNFNFAGDLEQLLLRTGIGFNLSENNNNFLLGYAFVKTARYTNETDKISFNESRLFQQFITKQSFNRFYITHRYRLEERWIGDTDMALRFRYLLGLNIPLNNKSLSKNTIYLSVYNELFMNTKGHGFDRDRIYGGVGYCFSKNLKLELGYMSQRLDGRHRNQTVINFINTIPFYKVEH